MAGAKVERTYYDYMCMTRDQRKSLIKEWQKEMFGETEKEVVPIRKFATIKQDNGLPDHFINDTPKRFVMKDIEGFNKLGFLEQEVRKDPAGSGCIFYDGQTDSNGKLIKFYVIESKIYVPWEDPNGIIKNGYCVSLSMDACKKPHKDSKGNPLFTIIGEYEGSLKLNIYGYGKSFFATNGSIKATLTTKTT